MPDLCRSLATAGAAAAAFVAVFLGLAWHMWPEVCCPRLTSRPAPEGPKDYCAGVGSNLGQDLETKGFTVVHGLLTDEEAQAMHDYHAGLPGNRYHPGYRHPVEGRELPVDATGMLMQVLPGIEANSSIRVVDPHDKHLTLMEFITASASDSRMVDFGWHQDMEGYYFSQSAFGYLNVYIFIQKPELYDAGVSVVPFDGLLARAPEFHELMKNGGASSHVDGRSLPGEPRMVSSLHGDPHTDRIFFLDFHLDDLACTPALRPGDALIFRGDTLHRTQTPRNSTRVSWSVRVFLSKFSAIRMLRGGIKKYERLVFQKGNFARTGVDAIMADLYKRWPLPQAIAPFLGPLLGFSLMLQIDIGMWYRKILLPLRKVVGRLIGEAEFPLHSAPFKGFR